MGRKFSAVIIALISVVVLLPICVSANSAEPPMYTIVCDNCPSDTVVYYEYEYKGTLYSKEAFKSNVAWESYFDIFLHHLNMDSQLCNIRIESAEKSFEQVIEHTGRYHLLYTLDFENETLTEGDHRQIRTPILAVLRVTLTLIIEGLIFWAFGYRKKRSWIVFLVVNLITQGYVNYSISEWGPPLDNYWFLGYVFMEFFVFAAEMTAIPLATKEQSKGKGVLFALAANMVSWFVGAVIIALLPI